MENLSRTIIDFFDESVQKYGQNPFLWEALKDIHYVQYT